MVLTLLTVVECADISNKGEDILSQEMVLYYPFLGDIAPLSLPVNYEINFCLAGSYNGSSCARH